jgi:hypothetical protein
MGIFLARSRCSVESESSSHTQSGRSVQNDSSGISGIVSRRQPAMSSMAEGPDGQPLGT